MLRNNVAFLTFLAILGLVRLALYVESGASADPETTKRFSEITYPEFGTQEPTRLLSGTADAYVIFNFDNSNDCQRCLTHVSSWSSLSRSFPNVEWVVILSNGDTTPAALRRIRKMDKVGKVFVDRDGEFSRSMNLSGFYKLIFLNREEKVNAIINEIPTTEGSRRKMIALELQKTLGIQ